MAMFKVTAIQATRFAVIALTCATLLLNPTSSFAEKKRQKVIDFEDDVIEGINKRPLDSLSQISERNKKRRKPHLYRKRVGFRNETLETIKEMRYTQ